MGSHQAFIDYIRRDITDLEDRFEIKHMAESGTRPEAPSTTWLSKLQSNPTRSLTSIFRGSWGILSLLLVASYIVLYLSQPITIIQQALVREPASALIAPLVILMSAFLISARFFQKQQHLHTVFNSLQPSFQLGHLGWILPLSVLVPSGLWIYASLVHTPLDSSSWSSLLSSFPLSHGLFLIALLMYLWLPSALISNRTPLGRHTGVLRFWPLLLIAASIVVTLLSTSIPLLYQGVLTLTTICVLSIHLVTKFVRSYGTTPEKALKNAFKLKLLLPSYTLALLATLAMLVY